MTEEEMKERTMQFGLRVLAMAEALPESSSGRAIRNQLCRSGTSVGAQYRAACRGRSRADFVNKLAGAEEEADESCYWMEVIIRGELLPEHRVEFLLDEGKQLTAILVAARKTASRKRKPEET